MRLREKSSDSIQGTPGMPMFIMLYGMSRSNGGFNYFYSIITFTVYFELILAVLYKSLTLHWNIFDRVLFSGNLNDVFPISKFILVFFVLTFFEILCLGIHLLVQIATKRYFGYTSKWFFYILVFLLILNSFPVVALLPLQSVYQDSSSSNIVTNYALIALSFIFTLIAHIFANWMCHGVPDKYTSFTCYIPHKFYVMLFCTVIFILCYTISLVGRSTFNQYFTLIIALLAIFILFMYTRINVTAHQFKMTSLILAELIHLIIMTFINILMLDVIDLTGELYLAINVLVYMFALFYINFDVHHSFNKIRNKISRMLATNDFTPYLKMKPNRIAYEMLHTIQLFDNYSLIDYVFKHHGRTFQFLEVEYLISEKISDIQRMIRSTQEMSALPQSSFIETSRRVCYDLNLLEYGYEEETFISKQCDFFVKKYAFLLSQFWNEIVFERSNGLLSICSEIYNCYKTMNVMFETCGAYGALKTQYDQFVQICPIKQVDDSDCSYEIASSNTKQNSKSKIFTHLQFYMSYYLIILVIIVFISLLYRRFYIIKDSWKLIKDFSLVSEKFEASSFSNRMFLGNTIFDAEALGQYLYDGKLWPTRFKNATYDTLYILDQFDDSLHDFYDDYSHFSEAHVLSPIFEETLPLITDYKVIDSTFLSGLQMKRNFIRDQTIANQKISAHPIWTFNGSFMYLAKVLSNTSEILSYDLSNDFEPEIYGFYAAITIVFIICLIFNIIYPFLQNDIYKEVFKTLFFLPKRQLKSHTQWLEDMADGITQHTSFEEEEDDMGYYQEDLANVNANQAFAADTLENNDSMLSYFEEKIKASGVSSTSNAALLILRFFYTFVIHLLLVGTLAGFIFILISRCKVLIDTLTVIRYAQFLPTGMLQLGHKFVVDVYNEEAAADTSTPEQRRYVVELIQILTSSVREAINNILDYSPDIVDSTLYISQSNSSDTSNFCMLEICSSILASITDYIQTEEVASSESIEWSISLLLYEASYYIPTCRESLYSNIEKYENVTEFYVYLFVVLYIILLIIVAIFNQTFDMFYPKPDDIAWSSIATMPQAVYNEFCHIVDIILLKTDIIKQNENVIDFFKENTALNVISVPVILLNPERQIVYINSNAQRIIDIDEHECMKQFAAAVSELNSIIKSNKQKNGNNNNNNTNNNNNNEYNEENYYNNNGDVVLNTNIYEKTIEMKNNKSFQLRIFKVDDLSSKLGPITYVCIFTDISSMKKGYINYYSAKNALKILYSQRLPDICVEKIFDPNGEMDCLTISSSFICTWYIGNITDLDTANLAKKCIRECVHQSDNIWVAYHSSSTFRIFFVTHDKPHADIAVKALYITLELMDKFHKNNIIARVFMAKADDLPGRPITDIPPVFETLGGNPFNFIISVMCQPKLVFVSREIYEILYNTEIEFSYETTIDVGSSAESLYRVNSSAMHTILNDPHLKQVVTRK